MTPPLDMEAVKRRARVKAERIANAQRALDAPDDGSRNDLLRKRQAIMFVGLNDTEDHRDCLDLIAEVERLNAKLEDQTERIAQLHRERGEAVAEVGRLRAELDRTRKPTEAMPSAMPGFNPACDFCGMPRLQVPKLIRAGSGGPYICSHCVDLCADILREEADR